MGITYQVLTDRLLRYKILFIAVGLVIFFSLVGSVVCRSWLPLLGLLAPIMLCGVFFCCDMIRVNRWQEQILAMWTQDRLDLDVFSETVLSTPGVPQNLLRGMLDSLPTRKKGFASMEPVTRNATARTIQVLNRCHLDRTAIVTLAFSVGMASLAWTTVAWSCRPITGCSDRPAPARFDSRLDHPPPAALASAGLSTHFARTRPARVHGNRPTTRLGVDPFPEKREVARFLGSRTCLDRTNHIWRTPVMSSSLHLRTSYDELPYPSLPYPYTHPDHLATLATLLGLRPATDRTPAACSSWAAPAAAT